MRRLGGVAAAAGMLLLLTGCGSQATAPSATPSVTVIESPSAAPASSTPPPSASATPSASASPSASTVPAGDSAPADQCPDDSLGISITVADGGGGAGSEYYNVLFTNTGGSSCVLRGTPGVSVVSSGGAQLGPAADRVQTGVKAVRLAVGQVVAAPLKIVNIGTDGGPLVGCRVVSGAGYRVYAPHSKKAVIVEDADAAACADGPVFMTVSPVIRFTD